MADGRHLGKIERLLYLSRGLSDFNEIWRDDARKMAISQQRFERF